MDWKLCPKIYHVWLLAKIYYCCIVGLLKAHIMCIKNNIIALGNYNYQTVCTRIVDVLT